jgi:hypothetical protein
VEALHIQAEDLPVVVEARIPVAVVAAEAADPTVAAAVVVEAAAAITEANSHSPRRSSGQSRWTSLAGSASEDLVAGALRESLLVYAAEVTSQRLDGRLRNESGEGRIRDRALVV